MEKYLSKEPMYMMEKAAEMGMYRQLPFHSHTSQYGQLKSYNTFDLAQIRAFLAERYGRIASGAFAKERDHGQEANHLSALKSLTDQAFSSELSQVETWTFEKRK